MTSILVSLVLTFRDSLRSRAFMQIEVLALQHQLGVLERSRPPRARLTRLELFVANSKLCCEHAL